MDASYFILDLSNAYEDALPHRAVTETAAQDLSENLSTRFAKKEASRQFVDHINLVLEELHRTAFLPGISSSHRATVCHALCSILQSCLLSGRTSLIALTQPEELPGKLLSINLSHAESLRIRSSREILATLTSILRGVEQETSIQTRSLIVQTQILRTVHAAQSDLDRTKVKPALQALEYLLKRDVLSLESITQEWRALDTSRAQTSDDQGDLNLLDALGLAILSFMTYSDVAPAAGAVFVAVYTKIEQRRFGISDNETYQSRIPLWASPIYINLERDWETLEPIQQQIFPDLFRLNPLKFEVFLDDLGFRDLIRDTVQAYADRKLILLFCALQVGKEVGLIRESGGALLEGCGIVINSADIIRPYLVNQLPEIRSAAFSLIISSPNQTFHFAKESLEAVQYSLPFFHSETDAKTRNSNLGLIRRLVERLRASSLALYRQSAERRGATLNRLTTSRILPSPELESPCKSSETLHNEFLLWYIEFLKTTIGPSSPYYQQIGGLKALLSLFHSGLDRSIPISRLPKRSQGQHKWAKQLSIFDGHLVRLLLDLLFNPYNDIRAIAATILELPGVFDISLISEGSILSTRSEYLVASSGRADHSDGLAKLLFLRYKLACRDMILKGLSQDSHKACAALMIESLLDQLEKKVRGADHNIAEAVAHAPFHAEIIGLRYMLEDSLKDGEIHNFTSIQQKIWTCCRSIWDVVQEVLCVDSPEGYVLEDEDPEFDIGTKDLLSFCWRALKESSLLLWALVINTPMTQKNSLAVLETRDLDRIGSLTFSQLASLRHRGAFTTVATTFAACCKRCHQSGAHRLLVEWYLKTRHEIIAISTSATRRSAGIPSIITGILSANPGDSFSLSIMDDLFDDAGKHPDGPRPEKGTSVPQVHALNCLKEIFSHTKLGLVSEPNIARGLEVAISSLRSNDWAIRNCGLMLLRALVDRLFGTNESTKQEVDGPTQSSKLSWDRYPQLPFLLISMLEPGKTESNGPGLAVSSEHSTESIHAVLPALEIVRRAGVPNKHGQIFRSLINLHMASRIWHVRHLAARAFLTLVNANQWVVEALRLLQPTWKSQNELHGRLLAVKYCLDHYKSHSGQDASWDFERIQMQLALSCKASLSMGDCSFTRAAFSDLLRGSEDSKNPALNFEPAGRKTCPSSADLSLQLQGATLADTYNPENLLDNDAKHLEPATKSWILLLYAASGQESSYNTRYAAVCSLAAFRASLHFPGGPIRTCPAFLPIYVILYELLNDDDTTIRETTLGVVSSILSPLNNHKLVPTAAGSALVRWLGDHCAESKEILTRYAFLRLTKQSGRFFSYEILENKLEDYVLRSFIPLRAFLVEALKVDASLFATEKQNLFIDPLRESRDWSDLLIFTGASHVYHQTLDGFKVWTVEGLEAFSEGICNGADGALGRCSNPDLFELGVRLIDAARVLVSWYKYEKLDCAEEEFQKIIERLKDFVERGRINNMHESLQLKAEEILASVFRH